MDSPARRRSRVLKHGVDRVVAWLCLPLALPVMAGVAAMIVVEDIARGRGSAPILYREIRYSAGRRFALMKFRVLTAEVARRLASEGIEEVKVHEHDQRSVSRVGALLVRFYLDELPQILHVAGGTMSLVGPRPILPRDLRRREALAPFGNKAGLAGTFQLAKGTADIVDLDLDYARRSAGLGPFGQLAYDLSIIARTVRKMLRGEGL
jgi:lipopolysaccharide/colanic/teichoic acid biosynthesis glycosyltransferase